MLAQCNARQKGNPPQMRYILAPLPHHHHEAVTSRSIASTQRGSADLGLSRIPLGPSHRDRASRAFRHSLSIPCRGIGKRWLSMAMLSVDRSILHHSFPHPSLLPFSQFSNTIHPPCEIGGRDAGEGCGCLRCLRHRHRHPLGSFVRVCMCLIHNNTQMARERR